MNPPRLLQAAMRSLRRRGLGPSRFLLIVSIAAQRMLLYERSSTGRSGSRPRYELRRRFRVSTSRFGPGQAMHSYQTPQGLHRIARKVGGGFPAGTIFKSRQPVGFIGNGQGLEASILHRILWLEGLEPGFNRGGNVDTFRRYIYLHGFGDETTLGRPRSRGCIHLAAADLLPLYDQLPLGSLIWIGDGERGRGEEGGRSHKRARFLSRCPALSPRGCGRGGA